MKKNFPLMVNFYHLPITGIAWLDYTPATYNMSEKTPAAVTPAPAP